MLIQRKLRLGRRAYRGLWKPPSVKPKQTQPLSLAFCLPTRAQQAPAVLRYAPLRRWQGAAHQSDWPGISEFLDVPPWMAASEQGTRAAVGAAALTAHTFGVEAVSMQPCAPPATGGVPLGAAYVENWKAPL